MPSLPLIGLTPISVDDRILDPPSGLCFACPSHDTHPHPRKWAPAPDGPLRERTLVLCFDGTGESFDADNSNIPQFLAMLKKDDPRQQVVYYQAGIGTYTSSVLKTPIVERASKVLDLMFASNIGDHIKEGYLFLMQNYRAGDQICIFGFSRGAITARALAGMLQKVGLLPPYNLEQLPFAYAMYAREDDDGLLLSALFKRTFSIDVRIKLVGVWDTVHSVGLIEKHLPFSGTNNAISYFRHALSLDERRVKFRPFFWTGRKPKKDGKDTKAPEHSEDGSEETLYTSPIRQDSGIVHHFEVGWNAKNGSETNVKEVFFAGAHCDVGGGSVKNGERHSLARISLRWMVRECFRVEAGIIFDVHMLKHEIGLDIEKDLDKGLNKDLDKDTDHTFAAPEPLLPGVSHLRRPSGAELEGFSFSHIPVAVISGLGSPFIWAWGQLSNLRLHNSKQFKRALEELERNRPISLGEPREELNDALSPIVDQINMHPGWNLIEWTPWLVKKQGVEESDSLSAYKWIWNRGEGREVYKGVMKSGIQVHKSVKTRMLAFPMDGSNKLYLPKIRFVIDGKPRRLTREEWLADEPEHFEWVD